MSLGHENLHRLMFLNNNFKKQNTSKKQRHCMKVFIHEYKHEKKNDTTRTLSFITCVVIGFQLARTYCHDPRIGDGVTPWL